MDKESFLNILTKYTPSELNEFISLNGKKKMVNAITFINNQKDQKKKEKENDSE